MEVVALQVFVSLLLVASSVILFIYSVKRRDYEHADRLALLPDLRGVEVDDLTGFVQGFVRKAGLEDEEGSLLERFRISQEIQPMLRWDALVCDEAEHFPTEWWPLLESLMTDSVDGQLAIFCALHCVAVAHKRHAGHLTQLAHVLRVENPIAPPHGVICGWLRHRWDHRSKQAWWRN